MTAARSRPPAEEQHAAPLSEPPTDATTDGSGAERPAQVGGGSLSAEEQHARLRALAEAAEAIEPGPWKLELDGMDGGPEDHATGDTCGRVFPHGAYTRSRPVNEYIAAVSPDVLLALLDALADAERERDLNHESLALTSEALQEEEDKHDAAEARADALAAELEHARQALEAIMRLPYGGVTPATLDIVRAALRQEGGGG